MPRRTPAALLSVLVVLGAACSSSDGRELPPADAGRTTTSVSTPVVAQPSEDDGVVEVFTLLSDAFANGGAIPAEHTCDGDGGSPPLEWASTPPAAELALVVRDPDAAGFVHWVVTGIDPLVQGFGQGGVPESAVEAGNDGGTTGWFGPCPPPGSTHTYVFTLHALPEPLALEAGLPADEAAGLVEGASSDQTSLTGTYERPAG